MVGRWPMNIGATGEGLPCVLPLESLRRHALVMGASGSGKTVLGKVIAEESIAKGLPVIAVDVQGDLTALALGAHDPAAAKFMARVESKVWTPASKVGSRFPPLVSISMSCSGSTRAALLRRERRDSRSSRSLDSMTASVTNSSRTCARRCIRGCSRSTVRKPGDCFTSMRSHRTYLRFGSRRARNHRSVKRSRRRPF